MIEQFSVEIDASNNDKQIRSNPILFWALNLICIPLVRKRGVFFFHIIKCHHLRLVTFGHSFAILKQLELVFYEI